MRNSQLVSVNETDSNSSLPLDFFNPPLLGRAGFEQKVIDKDPLVVNDDVVSIGVCPRGNVD